MLDDIKSLLIERYGDRWLNSINNQTGIAEDLSILEKDIMRISASSVWWVVECFFLPRRKSSRAMR